MFRTRSGVARAAAVLLALFLAPLLVAAESWHTCTLAGGHGRGTPRVERPAAVRALHAHPCLACSLTREVFPAVPVPLPGGPEAGRGPGIATVDAPTPRAPGGLLPPGRAPPA